MKRSIAEKIRERIDEQNLSVQGLEKKAGLKIHSVRNILTGHTQQPKIDTLIAIANALGCSLNELVGESEDEASSEQTLTIDFDNLDLLDDTIAYLLNELKKNNKTIASNKLFNAILEIYSYSEKHRNGQLDEAFASWWISKFQ